MKKMISFKIRTPIVSLGQTNRLTGKIYLAAVKIREDCASPHTAHFVSQ